ncbi:MAG: MFS transporter, partial [Chloroflexi bacterium]|nr:MFS transporter [Chloroflexota bacterium]
LVAAVAGLVGFLVWERRTRYPLVDLGLLGNRVFALSSLSSMMSFLSTSSVIFLIPFYLEGVLHYQPREVGTVLIAQPLAIALTAPLSGALSDRFGYRWLNLAGLIAICSSLALMSTLTVESTQLGVMTRLGLMGFGQGIFQSPNNNAIMGAAPKERLGLASAMMATMRNLGFSFGIAVGGTLFPLRLVAHGAELVGTPLEIGARNSQLFVGAMQETFLIAAALASIGLLSSIVRGGAPRDVRPMSAAPADIRR